MCSEAFEQFWDEDDDRWMLRNAVHQDGRYFHGHCAADQSTVEHSGAEDQSTANKGAVEESGTEMNTTDASDRVESKPASLAPVTEAGSAACVLPL